MKFSFITKACTIVTFSIICNASQQRTPLCSIPIIPVVGSYKPIECRTYVTDNIYFQGSADLVGGSYETTAKKIVINGQKHTLTEKQKPIFDYITRHVSFKIAQYDAVKEEIVIEYKVYETTGIIQSTETQGDTKITRESPKKELKDKQFTINYSQLTNTFTDREDHIENSTSLIPDSSQILNQEYNEKDRKYTTLLSFSGNQPTKVNVTNKPHTFFIKNNNLHTIQEEIISVPILNLIVPATFLIRYYDVQLTQGENVLKRPLFTLYNATRAINGLFLLLITYLAGNKIMHAYIA